MQVGQSGGGKGVQRLGNSGVGGTVQELGVSEAASQVNADKVRPGYHLAQ